MNSDTDLREAITQSISRLNHVGNFATAEMVADDIMTLLPAHEVKKVSHLRSCIVLLRDFATLEPLDLMSPYEIQQRLLAIVKKANYPGADAYPLATLAAEAERDAALADVARLEAERDELVEALDELVEIIDGAVNDDIVSSFSMDSFTTQPARALIAKHTEASDD